MILVNSSTSAYLVSSSIGGTSKMNQMHPLESRRLMDGDITIEAPGTVTCDTTSVEVVVTLSAPAAVDRRLAVTYAGEAEYGVDFTSSTSVLRISAGRTTGVITLFPDRRLDVATRSETLILRVQDAIGLDEEIITLANPTGGLTENQIKTISDIIEVNEGESNHAYTDTTGNITVGVGHNMGKPDEEVSQAVKDKFQAITGKNFDQVKAGNVNLTDDEVRKLFDADSKDHIRRAQNEIPNFDNLPAAVKLVNIDATFDMGSFANFPNFRESIAAGNWDQAAYDLMHKSRAADAAPSKYATDVGARASRNEAILKGQTVHEAEERNRRTGNTDPTGSMDDATRAVITKVNQW